MVIETKRPPNFKNLLISKNLIFGERELTFYPSFLNKNNFPLKTEGSNWVTILGEKKVFREFSQKTIFDQHYC